MDASLLVPKTVAGCKYGRLPIIAGIWIRPPPPTAASIAPAKNAKTIRLTMISISIFQTLLRGLRRVLAPGVFYHYFLPSLNIFHHHKPRPVQLLHARYYIPYHG